jgi:hypothetical protein
LAEASVPRFSLTLARRMARPSLTGHLLTSRLQALSSITVVVLLCCAIVAAKSASLSARMQSVRTCGWVEQQRRDFVRGVVSTATRPGPDSIKSLIRRKVSLVPEVAGDHSDPGPCRAGRHDRGEELDAQRDGDDRQGATEESAVPARSGRAEGFAGLPPRGGALDVSLAVRSLEGGCTLTAMGF